MPSVSSQHDADQKLLSISDQLKLYNLIWKRTIASQMIDATLHTVAVDLTVGKNLRFRANGSTIANPGFMTVYEEDTMTEADDEDACCRHLLRGYSQINDSITDQHFTEPPPRFREASLIKALEEHDIGRPSTYASIIQTLRNREYVIRESKRFGQRMLAES